MNISVVGMGLAKGLRGWECRSCGGSVTSRPVFPYRRDLPALLHGAGHRRHRGAEEHGPLLHGRAGHVAACHRKVIAGAGAQGCVLVSRCFLALRGRGGGGEQEQAQGMGPPGKVVLAAPCPVLTGVIAGVRTSAPLWGW